MGQNEETPESTRPEPARGRRLLVIWSMLVIAYVLVGTHLLWRPIEDHAVGYLGFAYRESFRSEPEGPERTEWILVSWRLAQTIGLTILLWVTGRFLVMMASHGLWAVWRQAKRWTPGGALLLGVYLIWGYHQGIWIDIDDEAVRTFGYDIEEGLFGHLTWSVRYRWEDEVYFRVITSTVHPTGLAYALFATTLLVGTFVAITFRRRESSRWRPPKPGRRLPGTADPRISKEEAPS